MDEDNDHEPVITTFSDMIKDLGQRGKKIASYFVLYWAHYLDLSMIEKLLVIINDLTLEQDLGDAVINEAKNVPIHEIKVQDLQNKYL